jgi:hypothetical protein
MPEYPKLPIPEVSQLDELRPPEPLPEQRMYKWAFDLVAPKDNWKKPIDAMVDAPMGKEDRELFKVMIKRAVMFYTGSVPIILDLGDKQIGVKAVGYYEAVGA